MTELTELAELSISEVVKGTKEVGINGEVMLIDSPIAWKLKPRRNIFVRTILHISVYVQDVLNNRISDKCEKENLWAIKPTANVIQLDIDQPEQWERFERLYSFLDRTLGVERWLRTTSKSGCMHVHILVRKELNDFTRICWQVLLGSDPVREVLNAVRVVAGATGEAIVLFERPEEAQKVIRCQCGKAYHEPKAGKAAA